MMTERSVRYGFVMAATWIMGASASAAESPEFLDDGVRVVSMSAQPSSIDLRHEFDYAQLLILGHTESGELVDLTRKAQRETPSDIVQIDAQGVVRPVSDGQGQLRFTFAEWQVEIPVRVTGLGTPYRADFIRDVAPALSKMGCNAGTCHGAKEGKNGFKLSLRGYDFEFDHQALTDDLASRRFNRAAPDQSLMLLKATGSIPHVGGVRTTTGETYYGLLRNWIASGAPLDRDAPRVVKIELQPQDVLVPRAGMQQQVRVLATRSDGSVRDVTQEAFVESGNIEVVGADRRGLLTMIRRGEAPVLARYEGTYTATTITVMGDRSGFQWPTSLAPRNEIDELVYAKLRRVKIQPSDLCTDEEFARRIHLDLTGLPPDSQWLRRFLDDARPSRAKRAELIDQLIGSRPYVEHWTNKWADLLQVNRKFLGEEGAVAFRDWIKASVATNKPYDQFVFEILTASGSTLDHPAAAYWKVLREPAPAMENTTHLFLATRFNCNKCHDHPFERWTQDQYYHLAAFFAQVDRKEDKRYAGQRIGGSAVEGATPKVEVIFDKASGDIHHDRTGQIASPRFPYEHGGMAREAKSRRMQLARWVTSRQNPYFARSYANRLWGYLFGVGIIEPIDDIRAGNPPTNPELLDMLTQRFIETGFDVQSLLRMICQSRTYQHSIRTNSWNEDDQINFSHALPRRLPAEVLFDAIHVAAGAKPRIAGVPVGLRAAELPDAGIKNPFLDDFGRPPRESACECERSSGVALGPVMKLINGPTVAAALTDPDGELAKLAASDLDDHQLIEEVFLRFLSRRPQPNELALGVEAFAAAGAEHEKLAAEFDAYKKELAVKQVAWQQSIQPPPTWKPLIATHLKSEAGAQFAKLEDGSVSVSRNLGQDVYTVIGTTDLGEITGLKLETLPDPALPGGGPGRAPNGNFVISELHVSVGTAADGSDASRIDLKRAVADFSQDGWAASGLIDGNEASGWAIMPEFNKPHTALLEFHEPVKIANGPAVLTVRITQHYPDGKHALGKFRLATTGSPHPARILQVPEEVARTLALSSERRSQQQREALTRYFQSLDPTYRRLKQKVERSAKQADHQRLTGVQDLAWALINTPAFLFNR